MIELDNKTSLKLNEQLLNDIATLFTSKEIELIITSEDEIQEINKTHRGVNAPTDVLSFPYQQMPMSPLGSIVISSQHVKKSAKKFGHTESDEGTLLFIHGLLHLLGFDHEVDNGEMREEETELIEKFNLPKSLIVRTQEEG
ncbi:MAG: rRNA maturation RNase YbeY [Sulfurimonas sp.]|nr:rRNA maturation RNase YbeY [Sulfurimonas sp.]